MSQLKMPTSLEMGRSFAAARATATSQPQRSQVVAACSRCPRQLRRYERLLRLPVAVQTEIDARRLPIMWAEKLFRLPHTEIEAIAAAIQRGHDAKTLVQQAVAAAPRARPQRPVPTDSETVKRDLLTLARAVLSDSFSRFLREVEARNTDTDAAEPLHKARAVALDIFKRPGFYTKHAK